MAADEGEPIEVKYDTDAEGCVTVEATVVFSNQEAYDALLEALRIASEPHDEMTELLTAIRENLEIAAAGLAFAIGFDAEPAVDNEDGQ